MMFHHVEMRTNSEMPPNGFARESAPRRHPGLLALVVPGAGGQTQGLFEEPVESGPEAVRVVSISAAPRAESL